MDEPSNANYFNRQALFTQCVFNGRNLTALSHQDSKSLLLFWIPERFEVLGEEGLAIIEDNADRILEEVGIEFREDPEVL